MEYKLPDRMRARLTSPHGGILLKNGIPLGENDYIEKGDELSIKLPGPAHPTPPYATKRFWEEIPVIGKWFYNRRTLRRTNINFFSVDWHE